MRDAVGLQHVVQRADGAGNRIVHVAGIGGDGAQASQVAEILIDHRQRCVGRPLRGDQRLELAVPGWQVEEERRVLRVRRPCRRRRELRLRREIGLLELFDGCDGFSPRRGAAPGPGVHGENHAAGAERVNAREDVGGFHPDADRAVAAHRVPGQSAALHLGDRPVVPVDVGHQILRDEAFPIARGRRRRVHAALVPRVRVGHHDDHLARAGRERLVDDLGYADEMLDAAEPAIIIVGVAVKEIHHRIAATRRRRITGRQIDRNVAIGRIAFEVALEGAAVHLDAFDRPLWAPWRLRCEAGGQRTESHRQGDTDGG